MKKATVLAIVAVIFLAGCGGGPGGGPEYVTVTFLNNYAGAADPVFMTKTVEKGTVVADPGVPSRTGTWVELGWFEEYPSTALPKEAGVKKFSFSTPVTADCNVYFRWGVGQQYISSATDATIAGMKAKILDGYVNDIYASELLFEHEHGDVFGFSTSGYSFSIKKVLDSPFTAGTSTANIWVEMIFGGKQPSDETHERVGMNYKITCLLSPIILQKEGWVNMIEDIAYANGSNEILISSYSKDYIEIASGGFWTPGRYYFRK